MRSRCLATMRLRRSNEEAVARALVWRQVDYRLVHVGMDGSCPLSLIVRSTEAMRKHGRRDSTQKPLVAYAQQRWFASWLDLADVGGGCPDGILGLHGNDFKVEFKDEHGALTDDQHKFIREWRGSPVHICRNEADVDRLLSSTVVNRRIATKQQRKHERLGNRTKIAREKDLWLDTEKR